MGEVVSFPFVGIEIWKGRERGADWQWYVEVFHPQGALIFWRGPSYDDARKHAAEAVKEFGGRITEDEGEAA